MNALAALYGGLKQDMRRLLLEGRCLTCGIPARAMLCAACARSLSGRSKGFCPLCGEIHAWPNLEPAPCARCLASPPPWRRFLFHGVYEGLLRDLILRLKLEGELSLARPLGLLLAAHPALQGPEPEDGAAAGPALAVPVPLHPARLRARGFNQVLELARPLAQKGYRLAPRILRRMVNTAPQTALPIDARRRNLRGAFAVNGNVRGRRILLLDDVATTCATLHEATDTLLRAGAALVDVLALARTAARR